MHRTNRTPTHTHELQPLERRRLLSLSPVTVNGDEVLIEGTEANDIITLSVQTATGGGKEVRVNVNGLVIHKSLTGINRIAVESLSGSDTVQIDEGTVRGIYVNAGPGNDTVVGGSGNDTLTGGKGDDALRGEAGNDRLTGNDGNDLLGGDAGNDRIDGGNGADTLTGDDGNDTLTGGPGVDQMFGDKGNDTFFSRDGTPDTVSGGDGFNRAQSDGIFVDGLSKIDVNLP